MDSTYFVHPFFNMSATIVKNNNVNVTQNIILDFMISLYFTHIFYRNE
jgi:hypothetical protein